METAKKESGWMSMQVNMDCNDWIVGLCGNHASARRVHDGPVYDGPIAGLPSDVLKELIERGFVTAN